jgi:exosortase A-associated hydrolase 2
VSDPSRAGRGHLVSGHFLAGPKGAVFVLLRAPPRARKCVLIVPPFAEEMNKSRRMLTEVALGLSQRGLATAIPDLYGTGDSAGDFADASWDGWLGDLTAVANWLNQEGFALSGILGVRLGAALAGAAVTSGALPEVERTVLWQPAFDGARVLGQFLRLRTAALLLQQDHKETLMELRSRLQAGETIEVAGYGLAGRLASDLDAVVPPGRLPEQFGYVQWMEVVSEHGATSPVPSTKLVEQSRASGAQVQMRACVGEPFWASAEIVRLPEVIAATVDAFASFPPVPAQTEHRAG